MLDHISFSERAELHFTAAEGTAAGLDIKVRLSLYSDIISLLPRALKALTHREGLERVQNGNIAYSRGRMSKCDKTRVTARNGPPVQTLNRHVRGLQWSSKTRVL